MRFKIIALFFFAFFILSGCNSENQSVNTGMGMRGTSVFVNERHGWTLAVPESWESHLYMTGEGEYTDFFFQYGGEIYTYYPAGVPPLFTIAVGKNVPDQEVTEGFKKIGARGSVAYYLHVTPAYEFEKMKPGEEKETLLAMLQKADEVAAGFKVIQSEFFETDHFKVIKTPIYNIKTEVLRKPLSKTTYTGINGGFLYLTEDTMEPRNISYHKDAELFEGKIEFGNDVEDFYRGILFDKYNYYLKETSQNPFAGEISEKNFMRLPTLVTYYDRNASRTYAKILHVENLEEIRAHFKGHPEIEIINAIGGKGFDRDQWGSGLGSVLDFVYDKLYPFERTVLGFKEEGGITYAYLMISKETLSLLALEDYLKILGFGESNCIILDGSGSSSMQVTDGSGKVLFLEKREDRRIYNMIRLIDSEGIKMK